MVAVTIITLTLLLIHLSTAAGSTFPVSCKLSPGGAEAVCVGWCPSYINAEITVLRCPHNGWRVISGTQLLGFAHLTALDLSHGRISQIHATSFRGMEELQHLNLSNNKLSALPPDVFSELPKLAFLDLSGNPLTLPVRVPFLVSSSLQTLDLSSCGLTYLGENTFGKLLALSEVRIRNNPLTEIDKCPFSGHIKFFILDADKETLSKLRTLCQHNRTKKNNALSPEGSNKTSTVTTSVAVTISTKQHGNHRKKNNALSPEGSNKTSTVTTSVAVTISTKQHGTLFVCLFAYILYTFL